MVIYQLSDDISQIELHFELTDIMVGKKENVTFPEPFLNMDISLNIALRSIKFSVYF